MVVIQWLAGMTPTFESYGFQFDPVIETRKAAAALRERYTTPTVGGGGGGGGLGGGGGHADGDGASPVSWF